MASGLTLDTGALIAFERRSPMFRDILTKARERGALITVPAAVVAQAWRGNSAQIARLLPGCIVEVLDEAHAKRIGVLLARVIGKADIVDASVVVGASLRGDAIVTSDPDDIHRLMAAASARLRLLKV